MKKTFFLIILIVIIRISGYSQINVFVEASVNYSFLQDIEVTNENIQYSPSSGYRVYSPSWSKLIENYDSKPGFDILVGIQKDINKKFNIETGLGYSMINYKRKDETFFDNYSFNNPFNISVYNGISVGQPFGNITSTGGSIIEPNEKIGNTNISYLTIPINFNYLIIQNKLSIGVGISSSIIIHSKQFKINYNIYNRNTSEKNTTSDGLSNYVLSGNFNIDYCLTKKIWITAKYQHAFSPVYDKAERFAGDAKVRLIKLGLRYYL